MLFTALQQYDSAQIQAELIQYLTELGLDESILNTTLRGDITIELGLDESILNTTLRGDITIGSLTSGLTERLIAKAAEEDRRRFREKQSEGIARAQKAGVAIGRPTRKQDKRLLADRRGSRTSDSIRYAICTWHRRSPDRRPPDCLAWHRVPSTAGCGRRVKPSKAPAAYHRRVFCAFHSLNSGFRPSAEPAFFCAIPHVSPDAVKHP